jgi:outer membrane protein assembly factor BamB
LFFDQHTLHDSGAIAQDYESNLAVATRGLDPAADLNGLTGVFAQMSDVGQRGHEMAGAGDVRGHRYRKEGGKLDVLPRRVNSCVRCVALSLALTACSSSFRPAPPVPPGEWTTAFGASDGAAYADQTIPDHVSVAWRKDWARGIVAPVVLAGNVALAATTSRSLVTFSTDNARKYWDWRFASPIAGPPLRRNQFVFVATRVRDGAVYAMDLTRGRRAWRRAIGGAQAEPLLIGNSLVVATVSGEVVSVATSDGRVEWRLQLRAPAAVMPVATESSVLVATTNDTLYSIDMAERRVSRSARLPATPSAPPLLFGDTLVLALHSGDVVAWSVTRLEELWRVHLNETVLAQPVRTPAGDLVLLTRSAELWRVAGGRSPVRMASLGGAASGSLTLGRDRLLVGRLDGALFCVSLDGTTLWREDLNGSIVTIVAVRDGTLWVPLLNGEVVSLR